MQAKQALKEAPKDDEALERQEEGEIDKGFTESSSSSEDELTEEGELSLSLIICLATRTSVVCVSICSLPCASFSLSLSLSLSPGKEIQKLLKMQSTEEEPDLDDSVNIDDVPSSNGKGEKV